MPCDIVRNVLGHAGWAAPSVLVVDDHASNRLAVASILEPLGVRVSEAIDGAHALRLCAREDYTLLLVDVQMPGMDGFEVVARLRDHERTRSLPVIFMTALDATHDRVAHAWKLDAVDYMTKPLDVDALSAKVRTFISLHLRQSEIIANLRDV